METIRQTVVENLKQLAHAPSIQMVERVRPWQPETKSKNEGDPDVRETAEEKDQSRMFMMGFSLKHANCSLQYQS
ncbi:hypothetical protein EB796_014751 [Bugula neritina]|uniref:Uncharacterized protein n=1 Tax=Bugula neritina TaxID=10212 RepID=A0A7J7JKR7_BUGNE|nr:hypothetical protein EB796_014751 [Bugula neritina]